MRAEATVRLGQRAGAVTPRGMRVAPLYCSAAEHIILIRGRQYNLNLRELHDSIFGDPRGGTVRFVIAKGAWIRSRSTSLPAMRTGSWPAMALTLIIENKGRIQGKGGTGGNGGSAVDAIGPGAPGEQGGDALLIERATTIINLVGEIWSGGGGGGGGGAIAALHPPSGLFIYMAGGGGGGGGGIDAGSGGIGGSSRDPFPGSPGAAGTATAGGVGGAPGSNAFATAGTGGTGGAPGQPGSSGGTGSSSTEYSATAGGAGGAAGRYVVGNALVTWTAVGDVRGSAA